MRHPVLLFAIIGNLLIAGPSLANDVNLHKHTPEEIKSVCEKAGGSFSQDSAGYGCGTDCHGKAGTACTVFCKPDQKCVAQVTGGRRPRHVIDALQAPHHGH